MENSEPTKRWLRDKHNGWMHQAMQKMGGSAPGMAVITSNNFRRRVNDRTGAQWASIIARILNP